MSGYVSGDVNVFGAISWIGFSTLDAIKTIGHVIMDKQDTNGVYALPDPDSKIEIKKSTEENKGGSVFGAVSDFFFERIDKAVEQQETNIYADPSATRTILDYSHKGARLLIVSFLVLKATVPF